MVQVVIERRQMLWSWRSVDADDCVYGVVALWCLVDVNDGGCPVVEFCAVFPGIEGVSVVSR